MSNKSHALVALVCLFMSLACIAEAYAFETALNPSLPVIPLGLVGLAILSAFFAGSHFEQMAD
jgi:uncharacterized membrane-anchored protein